MVYLLELVKTVFSNDEGNMLIDECKLMKLLLGCMYYTHKPYSELNIKILDINFTVFCLNLKFEHMHKYNLTYITMQFTGFCCPIPPCLKRTYFFYLKYKGAFATLNFFKESKVPPIHKDNNLRRDLPYLCKVHFFLRNSINSASPLLIQQAFCMKDQ